jgi:very-short-patch-repair endonuclease
MGDARPDSELEVAFAALLARRRLPPAVFQHPVLQYRLDAAWPTRRVAAEVDGWDKYTSRDQFQSQIQRDARLSAASWSIAHFTWHDVMRREAYVARILSSLLARASPFLATSA